MRKVKQSEVGEILQHIYDSEIHLKMGWMWDGGFDFLEGAKTSDFWQELVIERRTEESNITKGIEEMCRHLVLVYPRSGFAKWFTKKYGKKVELGRKYVAVITGKGKNCKCVDCPVLYGAECPTSK